MRKLFFAVLIVVLICPVIFAEPAKVKPETVLKNIEFVQGKDGKTLYSETEYVLVMNAEYESVVQILSNLEGPAKLFPHVVESTVLQRNDNGIRRRIKARYEILGMGVSYSYVEKINFIETTADKFKIESELVESLDGELKAYRGFWTAERLPELKDGQPRTRVRLYSFFDYSKPFFMQDIILKTFTDEENHLMLSCVEAAAVGE